MSIDPNSWYRITNQAIGPGTALDVINANNDGGLTLDGTAPWTGQFWHIVFQSPTRYILTTMFTGENMRLDVLVLGTNVTQPYLANITGDLGQQWNLNLQNDGTYKFTNEYTGPFVFMDICGSPSKPCLSSATDDVGQYWNLSEIETITASSTSSSSSASTSSSSSTSTSSSAFSTLSVTLSTTAVTTPSFLITGSPTPNVTTSAGQVSPTAPSPPSTGLSSAVKTAIGITIGLTVVLTTLIILLILAYCKCRRRRSRLEPRLEAPAILSMVHQPSSNPHSELAADQQLPQFDDRKSAVRLSPMSELEQVTPSSRWNL